MKDLQVYLNFNGNCEEALNFYKDALKGEIVSKQTYGEAPPMPGASDSNSNKIMHAVFKAEGVNFMASDAGEDHPIEIGTNISMSLNFTDESEEEAAFVALSDGGRITMPLQDTFWNARFGMLIDKFGTSWMFNCDKPKPDGAVGAANESVS